MLMLLIPWRCCAYNIFLVRYKVALFILMGMLILPPGLNAFTYEKGNLFLDVRNAVECRAPVAFNQDVPKEESSIFIER